MLQCCNALANEVVNNFPYFSMCVLLQNYLQRNTQQHINMYVQANNQNSKQNIQVKFTLQITIKIPMHTNRNTYIHTYICNKLQHMQMKTTTQIPKQKQKKKKTNAKNCCFSVRPWLKFRQSSKQNQNKNHTYSKIISKEYPRSLRIQSMLRTK